jgi:hypothetical protein
MRRKQRRRGYTGVLAQPMVRGQYGAEELQTRFWALADHYGISQDDPYLSTKLVVALARDHVPGFSTRRRAGRARAYDIGFVTELAWDFHWVRTARKRLRLKTGTDIILKLLADQHPRYKDISFEELKAVFHRKQPADLRSWPAISRYLAERGNVLKEHEAMRMVEAVPFLICEVIHSTKS